MVPGEMRFDDRSDADTRNAGVPTSAPARVIVKVRTPGYVPDGFQVRTRIDDVMFTAEAAEGAVTAAGDDPEVESVERARPLHPL